MARFDSWIMTVLPFMSSEKSCCGLRQKMYVKLVPIPMGQLSEELYKFLEIRELEDQKISTHSATDAGERK